MCLWCSDRDCANHTGVNCVSVWRAIRRILSDLWDESLLIIMTGLVGGILSLLIIPVPFVLAAHYNMTLRISERRVTSLRDWFRLGREHLRFFALWSLLATGVTIVLAGNVVFYLRLQYEWAWMLAYAFLGLLITWLLPQPFVPAFYLQQADRRLRTALRNTSVLLVSDPLSIVLLWLATVALGLPLAYFAWPILPALVPFVALISTHVVKRYAQPQT